MDINESLVRTESISEADVVHNQAFIIQWEEVIQSFNTGMLFIMGALMSGNPESKLHTFKSEILKTVGFKDLWNRESSSFFEYLQTIHNAAGIPVSDEDRDACELEVMTHLASDDTGIIYEVSPFLVFLKGIIQSYFDDKVKSILFVVDEIYCKNCPHVPAQRIQHLFPQSMNIPVYIDIRKTTFDEYINDFRAKNGVLNTVIVTTNPKVIVSSLEDPDFKNVTIICPDFPGLEFTPETFVYLNKKEFRNEYILYKQKPIVI